MPNRRNVYFFHPKNQETKALVSPLIELAKQYDFQVVDHFDSANIIVSIGGDGAFLQAVRQSGFRDDCLYAGVTTSDQLSFYCLNECSIRSGVIKTLSLDVFINENHFETFRGDGMIISTPTGSTAYNKSVSGAVVDPLIPCMQVSELASLNNNNYRTLGSSFILSAEHTLTLKLSNDNNHSPIIGIDNEALNARQVDQVQIRLSDRQIKTVKLKDNSFWQRVKRTFL